MSAPQVSTSRRLTIGWQHARQPAGLREHLDIYGPLPGGRRGRADPRGLVEAVSAAGLTGRGGAGFPTGKKMHSVAAQRGPATAVVANGVESEPASEKDQALLARAPHLVLDGAVLAARAVGAGTVHVCLDRTRGRQVSDVLRAVAERERAGLDPVRLLVHEIPHRYVSSEETALIRWLNGGEARPSVTPPRPFQKGVERGPTLVDNVETLAHIALIGRYGPDWFRRAGLPDAPGTMLVTVTGAVTDPGVYEIESGTRADEVLELGGLRPADAVLIGGYFGTWHPVRDVAGLPLTSAGLAEVGGSPGAGVVFALAQGGCGITETAAVLRFLAGQGAGQCGPCMFGLPAIAGDFAQLASGRPEGDVLARLDRRLGVIPGRGACRHPDGAVRLASSALRAFWADARAHAAGRPCAGAHRRGRAAGLLPVPHTAAGEGEWR
jgi:NADH:ubiquinone oxidoreductase subunit F (NADH-binding)